MTARAAWFANFAPVFADVGLSLGFTQEEIDDVLADNEVVQFLARAIMATSNYERAMRSFQRNLLLGRKGSTQAVLPDAPDTTAPPIPPTGVFERLEKTVRRIRVQPAYTPSLGARLGIIPRNPSRAIEPGLVPKFKVKVAGAYSFSISTTRAHYSMWLVEIRRDGATEWEAVGWFVKSPGVVKIEPTDPGKPELIYVRIRMIKDNKPVGNYSGIQTLVLAP